MEQNHMEVLFQKFIKNTISKKEYESLMAFIKNPEHKSAVEQMIKKNENRPRALFSSRSKRSEKNSVILFDNIINRINNTSEIGASKKKIISIHKIWKNNSYKIAASVVLFICAFYSYQNGFFGNQKVTVDPILIDPSAITLIRDNGNIEVISEDGQRQIIDAEGNIVGTQKGTQLDYTNKKITKTLVYNELSVPYGKQFDLVLSDGTQIKLNAGTSIKYPVQFIKGQNRKIYLKGEAYFVVAKDAAHPFVINANDINVKVLGTEFNMSYYPEDAEINTVLVEGSVLLYENAQDINEQSPTLLTPGYKASWSKINKKMSVDAVDISVYTAWKDGILLFKNTSFNTLRKKLERHFDVSIENNYTFLDNQVYTASFSEESIEDILDSFNEDTPFSYTKENKSILITGPIN
ncbi:MAG: FecR domain-containing protein [Cellulophaga sp.]